MLEENNDIVYVDTKSAKGKKEYRFSLFCGVPACWDSHVPSMMGR